MDFTGIDAEARGKLRVFKQGLEQRQKAIDAYIDAPATQRTIANFILRHRKGRQAPFDKLNAELEKRGAQLAGEDLGGKTPAAIWSTLRARGAVTYEPDARDAENCVTVDFLAIGWTRHRPLGDLTQGVWTLELKDHALGRFYQRGGDNLEAAIWSAHRGILCLDGRSIVQRNSPEFLFQPNRRDVWACECRLGADLLTGRDAVHFYIRTYLAFDQVKPDKERELIRPTHDQKHQIGMTWMKPDCYKRLVIEWHKPPAA